ncbi:MAG: D-glycero-beta-D-manno-heptose-7-phosphate kinase [Clostridia bacterium]|nr:D-glycero-beta-D-manno-heptose-7-phosphate kinase [Clostridia bacterium]
MNLIEKLDNITKKDILVIGDIMLDRYYFGISKRISPEAPVPILKKREEKMVLGGAANVAINIAKAGQKVTVLSVVGEDIQGNKLIDLLQKNNINTSLIIKDKDRCTSVKTRFIGQNNIQMFRFDEEITEPIEQETNNKILNMLEKHVTDYDIIVISDYNKGLLTVENTKKMIEIANKNNVKTLIDVKEPKYDKYKNAYLIKPNLDELNQITGMKVDSEEQILEAARTLLQEANCNYVLATRGKDGMILVSKEDYKIIKCMSREVYDVTGAGDTVISYLATCIANEISLLDAIQISNYAAGVGVSKMGTYAVSINEIQEYIEEENNVQLKNKIVTADKLVEILENKQNKKVVFTNGCFDIFHVGHSRYLRETSKLGDILVVGLNSDSSVKRLKGEKRPIVTQNERAELLASLEFVSYVVIFEEDTPYNLISKIKPDIITKGGDYNPNDVVGKDIIESYGGKVVICPLIEGKSTTNIIEKILQENK